MHNLARLAAETARKYTLRARRDPSRDGASPDGLPPYQFCALVVRSTVDGGDYTLPYQRGLICEKQHAWHYTQGWTR